MTLYSRRQLALLLGLVVASGVGLAIGEWRRANPEAAAAIETIDRMAEDDRPMSVATDVPVRPAAAAPPSRVPFGAPQRPPKPPPPPGPIDLNQASAAELTRLPGIGPVLAARIVAARDSDGPFASVDELRRVNGVGPSKLAAFRDRLTVSP